MRLCRCPVYHDAGSSRVPPTRPVPSAADIAGARRRSAACGPALPGPPVPSPDRGDRAGLEDRMSTSRVPPGETPPGEGSTASAHRERADGGLWEHPGVFVFLIVLGALMVAGFFMARIWGM
ncbi:DUF6480 family protein [Streptomyces sp. NPDC059104]|uniref:DUF6480 family protein n=1 Tax=Streptomyces sp. NPDC059104 TaxID=3346729 RepID=UPI0036D14659